MIIYFIIIKISFPGKFKALGQAFSHFPIQTIVIEITQLKSFVLLKMLTFSYYIFKNFHFTDCETTCTFKPLFQDKDSIYFDSI